MQIYALYPEVARIQAVQPSMIPVGYPSKIVCMYVCMIRVCMYICMHLSVSVRLRWL